MLSDSSIGVTPGSGVTAATHVVGGKEHSVLVPAELTGSIVNTPDYYIASKKFSIAVQAGVAINIVRPVGSTKIVKVLSAAFLARGDSSSSDVLSYPIQISRISSLHSVSTDFTGDAFGVANTTIPNAAANSEYCAKLDPRSPTLSTSDVRVTTTAAGTSQQILCETQARFGPSLPESYVSPLTGDLIRYELGEKSTGIVLREDESLQFTFTAVPVTGFMIISIVFSVE